MEQNFKEIIELIISLFDIRFMVIVFVTSQVLLKYTKLRTFKTNHKRLIVLLIGSIYAVLISNIDFMISNIGQSAFMLFNKYGISLFSTVLFYDIIYKKVLARLKT